MSELSATERCRNACYVMGFTHPHLLIIHSRLQYVEQTGENSVGTMGITSTGKVLIDTDFVKTLDREEIAGVMAHEMLHLVLNHHTRAGMRDKWSWNVATDMCINKALLVDGLKLPKSALLPPAEYNGDLYAEELYEWMMKNSKTPKKQKGQPAPGQGCAVIDDSQGQDQGEGQGQGEGEDQSGGEGEGQGEGQGQDQGEGQNKPDWRQVGIEMRAMAQAAGRGSQGIAHLLAPRQARTDWKKILRHGMNVACAKPGRDFQTYSKRHRRSGIEGPQFPGWIGATPRVAVAIDVSGSMDRKWVDLIVSECKSMIKTFAGVNIYVVAHTSDVVYEGWIAHNTSAKLSDAVQFSGGTDAQPAYDAIDKAGTFDSLVHFTDGELGSAWPESPAKRLIIGLFSRGVSTATPAGAHVILCELE